MSVNDKVVAFVKFAQEQKFEGFGAELDDTKDKLVKKDDSAYKGRNLAEVVGDLDTMKNPETASKAISGMAKAEGSGLRNPAYAKDGFVSNEALLQQLVSDRKNLAPSNKDYAGTYLKNPGLAVRDFAGAVGRGNTPAAIGAGVLAAGGIAGLYALYKKLRNQD
jgi:hypothetical protein